MIDFERFFAVPETFGAAGFHAAESEVHAIFLGGPPYRGKETRIFAWYGVPGRASSRTPVPGIILQHGGLGTAYAPWVGMWMKRGFAAIAIDIFGGVPDNRDGAFGGNTRPISPRHEFSGPGHLNQFAEADDPPEEQWPYHAVAGIISAHSFLASLDGVDAGRIGITGISWGGFAAELAAGFDRRLKFAAPVYGCGGFDSLRIVPRSLPAAKRGRWVELWDPNRHLPGVKTPFLWAGGTADFFFDIFNWNNSSKLTLPPCRALRINMPHSQRDGMNVPELLPFADAVVSGREFPRLTDAAADAAAGRLEARWAFHEVRIRSAQLIATRASGCWNDAIFRAQEAHFDPAAGIVTGTLPEEWTAAYLNLEDENGCFYSSEVLFR